MSFRNLLLIIVFVAGFSCMPEKEIPKIPLADFFRNPEKSNYTISPSGKYLAYLKPVNGRINIAIKEIGINKEKLVTNSDDFDIKNYFWIDDDFLVYLRDNKGDEIFRLYSVNISTGTTRLLTPYENTTVNIIHLNEKNRKELLIEMNNSDARQFDVYRLNAETGKLDLAAKNPGKIVRWIADNNGRVRIAVRKDNINDVIMYRSDEDEPFRELFRVSFPDSFQPVFFSDSNETFYALSNINRNFVAVIEYDPDKNKELNILYENPEVDADFLIHGGKGSKPVAVIYTTFKKQVHFINKDAEKLFRYLTSKIPDKEIIVAGMDTSETKFLLRTYSDRSLGSYYYFNMTNRKLTKLSDVSPWLNENFLSEMKPISFRAKDGLLINGYLTLPRNKKAQNLPVIIYPHGGPWARDYWGFNADVQFLANRGYAVLQINFRGSTGYGKEFFKLGFKEWGGKIQQDIKDGADWLLRQEIADPSRIAVYGKSFGGFCALSQLSKYPDFYACGIDVVGPSNIFSFLENIPSEWENTRNQLYNMIGDPVNDREMLIEHSPFFAADRIIAPVLIAQGANDRRVKKSESDLIVKALREKGKDVIYILKEDEGHGFVKEENKIELYRKIETFLSKHLMERKK